MLLLLLLFVIVDIYIYLKSFFITESIWRVYREYIRIYTRGP